MLDLNKGRKDKEILEIIDILNLKKSELKEKQEEIEKRIEKVQSTCSHLLIISEKNYNNQFNGERCLICDKYSQYGFNKLNSIVVNVSDFKYQFNYEEHLNRENPFYIKARKKLEEILNSDYGYSLDECKEIICNDLKEFNEFLKVKKLEKK